MIVLDTNVVSEPLAKTPDPRVATWLDTQSAQTLYLTTVTVGELRYGIAAMPPGHRRDLYASWLEDRTLPAFSGRILAYDLKSSAEYARLRAAARAAGLAIATADGMIAATAAASGFAVATRDTSPFEAAGVTTINPWR